MQKECVSRLFNRGGYVLDFSTEKFDTFTQASIGIPLCKKYGLSKGKSLEKYIDEASLHDVQKLLHDLLEYYETYIKATDSPEYESPFLKCKEILSSFPANPGLLALESLKEKFSSGYLKKEIENLVVLQETNPTDAIGKSKELVESSCKAILENLKIPYEKTWDLNVLADKTLETLKLKPKNIEKNVKASKEIHALLGNLRAIVSNVAALRNSYGSGHGKDQSYRGLDSRCAKLAVGCSATFCEFLWNTYELKFLEKHHGHDGKAV